MKKYFAKLLIIYTLLFCFAGCGQKETPAVDEAAPSIREQMEIQEDVQTEPENVAEEPADEGIPEVMEEPIKEIDIIGEKIEALTLEEKAAQLFVILPEALVPEVETVTAAGDATKNAFEEIPVGGFIYMAKNLENEEQTKTMIANVQNISMERIGLPALITVDEEGGTVARISGTEKFGIAKFENMAEVGAAQDFDRAFEIGQTMGTYLSDLGFNVDFAPVADVLTNPDNQVVKKRSFGNDAQTVSKMTEEIRRGLEEQGVYATYKHFPGHGMTEADSHEGYAYSNKSLEELRVAELVPFQAGIENGIRFVMVGHISLPTIIGDHTPSSLSSVIITDLLRNEMGYDGIVITDALNMGAIVNEYSSAEAAVKALQAGVDIILMPDNFKEAYEGVLKAVGAGTLSEERIDESLRRILEVKLELINRQDI